MGKECRLFVFNSKRNCIEVASQALLMAAGVIISVVIISVMVVQMRSASEMSNAIGNEITDRVEDIKNSSIVQYDGMIVNGSDVVNFYKKQFDEYPVGTTAPFVIEIDHSNDGIANGIEYTNCSKSYELRDSTSMHFVKPSSQWKCSVKKNKNGIITKIVFTKQ